MNSTELVAATLGLSTKPIVGWWVIVPAPGSFKIAARSRPSRVHRLFARWLLGWTWEDAA